MNPQTGAVLASVSKPDFNPNTVDSDWEILVNDSANSSLLNRATQGAILQVRFLKWWMHWLI